MLRELHITNLAVIADARIELAPGFNCFTGATGAGKSLVIGALEILLGLRSAAEMLRPDCDEGRVSGIFQIRGEETLERIERAADVQVRQDGGEILITRRLYASGRTSISLNGNPITLAMLRAVAEHLVDVHGQHDHQFLLKPANQLDVLDQFGGLRPLRNQYRAAYERLQEARRRLDELSAGGALRRQQLELYRFQADEIDAAQLSPGEYEELTARAAVLGNLQKLKRELGQVHVALYEADGSVLEKLKLMSAVLAELSGIDPQLAGISKSLRDSTIQLEEVAFDLSRYTDRLDLDPSELAEVNERLNALNRILNKYGDDAQAVLAYRDQIGRQIQEMQKQSDDLSSIESTLATLGREVESLGRQLSAARKAAAGKLAPLVSAELAELGMEKAVFSVAFACPSADGRELIASPSGMDQIEFMVRTNPGQAELPLRRIASGGELSRIMLALKGILAQSDRVSVLVFDEIDANVGGRLGSVIGRKLRRLAGHHQVLCITHLPQIASFAERHLTVRKEVGQNTAVSSVRCVNGEQRIEELAEMIGGARITQTTRAQARELLQMAQQEAAAPAAASRGRRSRRAQRPGHGAPGHLPAAEQ
jgi:DNA repair protein RecN (Recombination protein N)